MAHHTWCNYWMRSEKDCKFCKRLKEKYPEEGLNPDELLENYFPDVKKIEKLKDGIGVGGRLTRDKE